MLNNFNKISSDAKVAYFLGLSEIIIPKLLDSENYLAVRTSLNKCWEWLEYKKLEADDLYWYLENMDDTGIITLMQSEEDEEKLKVWICIGDAVAYTIRQAYEYQGDEYLPSTIEGVDIEETYEEFDKNFNEIMSSISDKIKNNFLEYLIKKHPQGIESKVVNHEVLKILDYDK